MIIYIFVVYYIVTMKYKCASVREVACECVRVNACEWAWVIACVGMCVQPGVHKNSFWYSLWEIVDNKKRGKETENEEEEKDDDMNE